jgi:aldose 1-epimerase
MEFMKITREPFGITSDGKKVDEITLINERGYSCTLITLGARIISFKGPDKNHKIEELTKCPHELSELEKSDNYYGATIGRYSNRISNGRFSIDGTEYQLELNGDGYQLHGGPRGFNSVLWEAFAMREDHRASVKFTHTSVDGDQGFPGTLDIAVTVTLTEENELFFVYEAVTDAPTVVGMTNHTYWNLSGDRKDKVYSHQVKINAENIIETSENLVPTGKILPVDDTRFDLRVPRVLGKLERGFDTCFILPDKKGVLEAAEVYEPASGRIMKVITDAPGIQFYTDNFDDEDQHGSFCLEAQEIPDAFNHGDYFSRILRPGEFYRQVTIHSFSTTD